MGIGHQRRARAIFGLGDLSLMAAGWLGYRTWPRDLRLGIPVPRLPAFEIANGRSALRAPCAAVVATVETFRDELLAYLHFEHLRSRPEIDEGRVLLTALEAEDGPVYRIELALEADLLAAVPYGQKVAQTQFFTTSHRGQRALIVKR